MKRHICAGAGALVLALACAGTATAGGLPVLGEPQLDLQSVSLGDQTVGEQTNTADVTQEQGNGNVNISPAISMGGDASTWSAQGNGNTALAGVEQSNEASQSQSADQGQWAADGSSRCCDGRGEETAQVLEGGDQSVGEQTNTADVTQSQGNGNVNVSPAISIGGDASTWNEQGNGNTAVAVVEQANAVDQSQDVSQTQRTSDGGTCCGAPSQGATQEAELGDQTVGEQQNDASVTQEQGNRNLNLSPAIAIGGGKHATCGSSCSKNKGGDAGASTVNAQGNGNKAVALIEQQNTVTQTQDVRQKQALSTDGCCKNPCKTSCGGKPHTCSTWCGKAEDAEPKHAKPKHAKHDCCEGSRQARVQHVRGGDQSVEKQKNETDVTQKQGNDNVNRSPAFAWAGSKHPQCSKPLYGTCGRHGDNHGATASTWNAQGNGNKAVARVSQRNDVSQAQSTWQGQSLVERCKEVMRW
jgi:hypothetical protein